MYLGYFGAEPGVAAALGGLAGFLGFCTVAILAALRLGSHLEERPKGKV